MPLLCWMRSDKMKLIKVDNGAVTKEIEESKLEEHINKGYKIVEEKPKTKK